MTSTSGAVRISDIYLDMQWNRAPDHLYLDEHTARHLRARGVTMVRVAPTFWSRMTRRGRRLSGRDISLNRYLATR